MSYAYETGPVIPGEFAIVRSYDALATALAVAEDALAKCAEREEQLRKEATDAENTQLAVQRCYEASNNELTRLLNDSTESAKRFQCTYARVLDERNLLAARVEILERDAMKVVAAPDEPRTANCPDDAMEPPATSDVGPPPTADVGSLATTDVKPPATADVKPSPAVDVEPPPAADVEPAPAVDVEPPAAADVEPPAAADVEPAPAVDVESAPAVDVESAPAADVEPPELVGVQPTAVFRPQRRSKMVAIERLQSNGKKRGRGSA